MKPANRREQTEIAIGEQLDAKNVDADAARSLRIAPEGVDLPAKPRMIHQQVGEKHDDAHDQYRAARFSRCRQRAVLS